jgi:hypothetical protein
VRVVVDLPDDLVSEVERRKPNATWQSLIVDALTYAIAQADAQQPDTDHLGGDAA